MNKKNVVTIALIGLVFLVGAFMIVFKYGIMPGRTDRAEAQNIEWIRQFGTSENDKALDVSVNSSAIYLVGETYGALPGQISSGEADAYVRKYDVNGNDVWTRQFGTTSYENASAVAVDSSGIYVAGRTYGALLGQISSGEADAYVRKYDVNGNEEWTRQFGSSSYDYVYGVLADSSGLYVVGVTGGTLPGQSSAGTDDAYIRKYNAGGTEQWTKQFGTSAYDFATAVSANSSGIYVVGYTSGDLGQSSAGADDAYIRKYDVNGNEVWTRQFGTSSLDYAFAVSANSSGIYVVGYTNGVLGQSPAGSNDAYIRKYDTGGTEQWTKQFGTSTADFATAVAADSSGIYVAGYTSGDLGQSSAGADDAYVRKYDIGGTEQWTKQFGTSTADLAFAVSADSSEIYVVGYTNGDLGQSSAGGEDAYIAKILLDETPPTTTASLSDSQGVEGWWRTNVTVTLSAIDNGGASPTGVKETKYQINNGGWTTYTASFVVSDEGTNEVEYYSIDNAGNTEATKSATVKIDKTDPEITKTSPQAGAEYLEKTTIDLTFSVTDALSDVKSWVVKLDGDPEPICDQSTACPASIGPLALGSHAVRVEAEDKAGNQAVDEETFTVITAEEAVDNIIDDVVDLDIKKGVEKSLNSQLDVIKKLLESDKPADKKAAINMLQAFINECDAQRGKELTDAQADLLIQQAQAIIGIL